MADITICGKRLLIIMIISFQMVCFCACSSSQVPENKPAAIELNPNDENELTELNDGQELEQDTNTTEKIVFSDDSYVIKENNGITIIEDYYDKNGNPTSTHYCDLDGAIRSKHEYVVDKKGNVIETWYYQGDGTLETYCKSTYDEHGNELTCTWYDSKGNYEEYEEFAYDELDRQVYYAIYDSEHLKYWWSVTEYLDGVAKTTTYDENNSIIDTEEVEY